MSVYPTRTRPRAGLLDAAGPVCPIPQQGGEAEDFWEHYEEAPRQTISGAILGLAIRLVLAASLWLWARGNAAPLTDWLSWRAWFAPETGFQASVELWCPDLITLASETVAMLALAAASATAILLALGFLTRLAGLAVVLGAIAFVTCVSMGAWNAAAVYGALGLYLLLRGPGALSLDALLGRIARP